MPRYPDVHQSRTTLYSYEFLKILSFDENVEEILARSGEIFLDVIIRKIIFKISNVEEILTLPGNFINLIFTSLKNNLNKNLISELIYFLSSTSNSIESSIPLDYNNLVKICQDLELHDEVIFIFIEIFKSEQLALNYLIESRNFESFCLLVFAVYNFEDYSFGQKSTTTSKTKRKTHKFTQINNKIINNFICQIIKSEATKTINELDSESRLIESDLFLNLLKLMPINDAIEIIEFIIKLAEGFEIIFVLPEKFVKFMMGNLSDFYGIFLEFDTGRGYLGEKYEKRNIFFIYSYFIFIYSFANNITSISHFSSQKFTSTGLSKLF